MLQETSGESDWAGVELEEFMQCEHNMAVNRQTRMLADLGTANFRWDTSRVWTVDKI